MSGSLAEAAGAPVDGYPCYTMKQLAQWQPLMPISEMAKCFCHPREVVEFMKSPIGQVAYAEWAKKPLPVNPDDALELMIKLQVRFLGQGRQLPKENLAEKKNESGLTGDAAPPTSGGATIATLGT